jgi:hypothetical protein
VARSVSGSGVVRGVGHTGLGALRSHSNLNCAGGSGGSSRPGRYQMATKYSSIIMESRFNL